jgi:hypothetical protein
MWVEVTVGRYDIEAALFVTWASPRSWSFEDRSAPKLELGSEGRVQRRFMLDKWEVCLVEDWRSQVGLLSQGKLGNE